MDCTLPIPAPHALGDIRNFAWVAPGILARGEQPRLDRTTFQTLCDQGIRSIVSLRPDGEVPPVRGVRVWPEYHVAEEQTLAEEFGMRFGHAPLADFSAPHPRELAQALVVLDDAVASASPTYVHCRAGAGRVTLVTGAWMIAQGHSGDQVAATYQRFMEHVAQTAGLAREQW